MNTSQAKRILHGFHPGVWPIYADWLEEQGDMRSAAVWRWRGVVGSAFVEWLRHPETLEDVIWLGDGYNLFASWKKCLNLSLHLDSTNSITMKGEQPGILLEGGSYYSSICIAKFRLLRPTVRDLERFLIGGLRLPIKHGVGRYMKAHLCQIADVCLEHKEKR